ncbi:hypothetical protein [Streptomyces triculaminicus]|nr:hypothetical protein [Streptomyces triculaminicus]
MRSQSSAAASWNRGLSSVPPTAGGKSTWWRRQLAHGGAADAG